jgi:glycosyltransferase involved in cell wall biosynthesis
MKILLLHSSSDVYGASKIFLGTVQLLKKRNHDVWVVLSEDGPLVKKLASAGATVLMVRLGILRRKYFNPRGIINRIATLLRARKQLQELIRKEKIELVYSNTTGVLAGAFAARNCGVRHIWHVHEIIENPFWLKQLLGHLMNRYAVGIIAVSEAVKQSWESVLPAERITVIQNGIDYSPYLEHEQTLTKELQLPTAAIVIGMVGRVHYWKGQSYFLKLAGQLHQKHPSLHFLLAGDAYPGYEYLYQEMQTQIETLQLSEVVHNLGFREDIPAVMQTIDLLLLPSQQPDPFPTVILEAMASAKPVIATQFGGAVEMIDAGITGDLMPADQVDTAVSVIESWLDKNRLQAAGEAGRKRVLEKFSLEAWEHKMINYLE